jgi:DNA-directed RNA polymerase subunit RPC12/RpoP
MNFEKKHPSGADEWFCPTCGRRMLINWKPKFRRTILAEGEPDITHVGFRINIPVVGNLTLPFVEGPSYEYLETLDLDIDESRLFPWILWMEENGFEDLWDIDIPQT